MLLQKKKRYLLSTFIFLFLLLGTGAGFFLLKNSQDVRQQATGCQPGEPYCSCNINNQQCQLIDPDGPRTIVEQGGLENLKGILATSFTGVRPTNGGACGGVWMNNFCYMPGDEIAGGFIVVESGRYNYPYLEKKVVYDSVSSGSETVTNKTGDIYSLGENCGGHSYRIGNNCYAFGAVVNGYIVMPARTSNCDNSTGNYCYQHLKPITVSYNDWQAAVKKYEETGNLSALEKLYKDTYGISLEPGKLYNAKASNADLLRAQALIASLTSAEVIQNNAKAENDALKAKGNLTKEEQAIYDFNNQIIATPSLAKNYKVFDQLNSATSQKITTNSAISQMYSDLVTTTNKNELDKLAREKFEEIFGYDPSSKYGDLNAILGAFGINPTQLDKDRENYNIAIKEQNLTQSYVENQGGDKPKEDLLALYKLYVGSEPKYRMTTQELGKEVAKYNSQLALSLYAQTQDVSYLNNYYTNNFNVSPTQLTRILGDPEALLKTIYGTEFGSEFYKKSIVLPNRFNDAISKFEKDAGTSLAAVCKDLGVTHCNITETNATTTLSLMLDKIYEGNVDVNIPELASQYSNQITAHLAKESTQSFWEKFAATMALGLSADGLSRASLVSETASEGLDSLFKNEAAATANYNLVQEASKIFNASQAFSYATENRSSLSDYTWGLSYGNALMADNVFDREFTAEKMKLNTGQTLSLTFNQLSSQIANVDVAQNIATNYATSKYYDYTGPADTRIANVALLGASNLGVLDYNYQEAQKGYYTAKDLRSLVEGIGSAATYVSALVTANETNQAMRYQNMYSGTNNVVAIDPVDYAKQASTEFKTNYRQVTSDDLYKNYVISADQNNVDKISFEQFINDPEVQRSSQELDFERLEKVVAPATAIVVLPVMMATGVAAPIILGAASSTFSLYQGAGMKAQALEIQRIDIETRENAIVQSYIESGATDWQIANLQKDLDLQVATLNKQGNLMLANSAVAALTSAGGLLNTAARTASSVNTAKLLAKSGQILSKAGQVGGITMGSYNTVNSAISSYNAFSNSNQLFDNKFWEGALSATSSLVAASGVAGNTFGLLGPTTYTNKIDYFLDKLNVPVGAGLDLQQVSQACFGSSGAFSEKDCTNAWIGLALSVGQNISQVSSSYKAYTNDQEAGRLTDIQKQIDAIDLEILALSGPNKGLKAGLQINDLAVQRVNLVNQIASFDPTVTRQLAVSNSTEDYLAASRRISSDLESKAQAAIDAGQDAQALRLIEQAEIFKNKPLEVSALRDQISAIDEQVSKKGLFLSINELTDLQQKRSSLVNQLESNIKDLSSVESMRNQNEILLQTVKADTAFQELNRLLAIDTQKADLVRMYTLDGIDVVKYQAELDANNKTVKLETDSSKRLESIAVLQEGLSKITDLETQKRQLLADLGTDSDQDLRNEISFIDGEIARLRNQGGLNEAETIRVADLASQKDSLSVGLAKSDAIDAEISGIHKITDTFSADNRSFIQKVADVFSPNKAKNEAYYKSLDLTREAETLKTKLSEAEQNGANTQDLKEQLADVNRQILDQKYVLANDIANPSTNLIQRVAEIVPNRKVNLQIRDLKNAAKKLGNNTSELAKSIASKELEIKRLREQGVLNEKDTNTVSSLETELADLRKTAQNYLKGTNAIITVDQEGTHTKYLVADTEAGKKSGIKQKQLDILNDELKKFEDFMRQGQTEEQKATKPWKIYSGTDSFKDQDIFLLAELESFGSGNRGSVFGALPGMGKTDVVMPFNILLKQRLTGESQFVVFPEGKLTKPWTTGGDNPVPNKEFIDYVEKNFGVGSVVIVKANDFNIDPATITKAKFVITTKDVAFDLQNTDTQLGATLRNKWKNSFVHADEVDWTFNPNENYKLSGTQVALKDKSEFNLYLGAQKSVLGLDENGNFISNGLSSLRNLVNQLETSRSIPEGIIRTADGKGGKFADINLEKQVLSEWLNTWGGQSKIADLDMSADIATVRQKINNYLSIDTDAQTHNHRAELAMINETVNFLSRVPGEDYGLARNTRMNGDIEEIINSIAPKEQNRPTGRSYSAVAESLLYNTLGARAVGANGQVDLAKLTVGESGSEINYAALMLESKGFSLYTGTPETVAKIYKMAYGIELKAFTASAVDDSIARMNKSDSKVFTDLESQIASRLTENKDQIFVNMVSGLRSNEVALRDLVTKVSAIDTDNKQYKKLMLIGAGGKLTEYDLVNGNLQYVRDFPTTKDLNTRTAELNVNNERFIKFYEYGAHVGVDTANDVNISRAVGLCNGCDETTFAQGINRVRVQVVDDPNNPGKKITISAPMDVVWFDHPAGKTNVSIDDFATAIQSKQIINEAIAEVSFKETLLKNSVDTAFTDLIDLARNGKKGFLGLGAYKANQDLVAQLEVAQQKWKETTQMNYMLSSDSDTPQQKLEKTALQVAGAYEELSRLLVGSGEPAKLLASRADGAIGNNVVKLTFSGDDNYQALGEKPSYRQIVELINQSSKHLENVDIAFTNRGSQTEVVQSEMAKAAAVQADVSTSIVDDIQNQNILQRTTQAITQSINSTYNYVINLFSGQESKSELLAQKDKAISDLKITNKQAMADLENLQTAEEISEFVAAKQATYQKLKDQFAALNTNRPAINNEEDYQVQSERLTETLATVQDLQDKSGLTFVEIDQDGNIQRVNEDQFQNLSTFRARAEVQIEKLAKETEKEAEQQRLLAEQQQKETDKKEQERLAEEEAKRLIAERAEQDKLAEEAAEKARLEQEVVPQILHSIGRGEANSLQTIPGITTVSRNHAQIIKDSSGNLYVRDLSSTFGTYVNNKKINANENLLLNENDMVFVGDSEHGDGVSFVVFKNVDGQLDLKVSELVFLTSQSRIATLSELNNFDPVEGLQDLYKTSRADRPAIIAKYKENLMLQKQGIARTQDFIISTIEQDPEIDIDGFIEKAKDHALAQGLNLDQIAKVTSSLRSYEYKRQRADKIINLYDDPKVLFESAFGFKPIGDVQVKRVSHQVVFYAGALDVGRAFNGSESQSTDSNRGRNLTRFIVDNFISIKNLATDYLTGLSTAGFQTSSSKIFDSNHQILVLNNLFSETQESTLRHELRHAIVGLLSEEGVFGAVVSEKAFTKFMDVVDDNANLDEFNRAASEFAYETRKNSEGRFANELIAQIVGSTKGRINFLHKLELFSSLNFSSSYKHVAKAKKYYQSIDFYDENIPQDENYIQSYLQIINKYYGFQAQLTLTNDAINAYNTLIDKGYSQEETFAILQSVRTDHWLKNADRMPSLLTEDLKNLEPTEEQADLESEKIKEAESTVQAEDKEIDDKVSDSQKPNWRIGFFDSLGEQLNRFSKPKEKQDAVERMDVMTPEERANLELLAQSYGNLNVQMQELNRQINDTELDLREAQEQENNLNKIKKNLEDAKFNSKQLQSELEELQKQRKELFIESENISKQINSLSNEIKGSVTETEQALAAQKVRDSLVLGLDRAIDQSVRKLVAQLKNKINMSRDNATKQISQIISDEIRNFNFAQKLAIGLRSLPEFQNDVEGADAYVKDILSTLTYERFIAKHMASDRLTIQESKTTQRNITAIGDVHGDWNAFVRLLSGQVTNEKGQRVSKSLIDRNGNWIGGENDSLILTGDLFDRAPDGVNSAQTAERIMRLQQQAGNFSDGTPRVKVLLGNHDVNAILAYWQMRSLISQEGYSKEEAAKIGSYTGMSPSITASDLLYLYNNQQLINWAMNLDAMAIENGTLYMHSDITTYDNYGRSVEEVNNKIRSIIQGKDGLNALENLMSVLTKRGQLDSADNVSYLLRTYGANHIVHGHSQGAISRDPRVDNIDGGLSEKYAKRLNLGQNRGRFYTQSVPGVPELNISIDSNLPNQKLESVLPRPLSNNLIQADQQSASNRQQLEQLRLESEKLNSEVDKIDLKIEEKEFGFRAILLTEADLQKQLSSLKVDKSVEETKNSLTNLEDRLLGQVLLLGKAKELLEAQKEIVDLLGALRGVGMKVGAVLIEENALDDVKNFGQRLLDLMTEAVDQQLLNRQDSTGLINSIIKQSISLGGLVSRVNDTVGLVDKIQTAFQEATKLQNNVQRRLELTDEINTLIKESNQNQIVLDDDLSEMSVEELEEILVDLKISQEPNLNNTESFEEENQADNKKFDDLCSDCNRVREETKVGMQTVDALITQSELKLAQADQARTSIDSTPDQASQLKAQAEVLEKEAATLQQQALDRIDETRKEVVNTHGMQNQCVQLYLNAWVDTREAEIKQTKNSANKAIDSVYDATLIAEELLNSNNMEVIERKGFLGIGKKTTQIALSTEDILDIEQILDNSDPTQPGLKQMAEFEREEGKINKKKLVGGILAGIEKPAKNTTLFPDLLQTGRNLIFNFFPSLRKWEALIPVSGDMVDPQLQETFPEFVPQMVDRGIPYLENYLKDKPAYNAAVLSLLLPASSDIRIIEVNLDDIIGSSYLSRTEMPQANNWWDILIHQERIHEYVAMLVDYGVDQALDGIELIDLGNGKYSVGGDGNTRIAAMKALGVKTARLSVRNYNLLGENLVSENSISLLEERKNQGLWSGEIYQEGADYFIRVDSYVHPWVFLEGWETLKRDFKINSDLSKFSDELFFQEMSRSEVAEELEKYVRPVLDMDEELDLIPLSEEIALNSTDHIESKPGYTKESVLERIKWILNRDHYNFRFLNREGEVNTDLQNFADSLIDLINKERVAEGKPPIPSVKIYVSLSQNINAFALPDGSIVLNQGLINALETKDQLFAILAHEVSHFEDNFLNWSFMSDSAATNRAMEYKADSIFLKKLAELNVNPRASLEALEILDSHSSVSPSEDSFWKKRSVTLPDDDQKIVQSADTTHGSIFNRVVIPEIKSRYIEMGIEKNITSTVMPPSWKKPVNRGLQYELVNLPKNRYWERLFTTATEEVKRNYYHNFLRSFYENIDKKVQYLNDQSRSDKSKLNFWQKIYNTIYFQKLLGQCLQELNKFNFLINQLNPNSDEYRETALLFATSDSIYSFGTFKETLDKILDAGYQRIYFRPSLVFFEIEKRKKNLALTEEDINLNFFQSMADEGHWKDIFSQQKLDGKIHIRSLIDHILYKKVKGNSYFPNHSSFQEYIDPIINDFYFMIDIRDSLDQKTKNFFEKEFRGVLLSLVDDLEDALIKEFRKQRDDFSVNNYWDEIVKLMFEIDGISNQEILDTILKNYNFRADLSDDEKDNFEIYLRNKLGLPEMSSRDVSPIKLFALEINSQSFDLAKTKKPEELEQLLIDQFIQVENKEDLINEMYYLINNRFITYDVREWFRSQFIDFALKKENFLKIYPGDESNERERYLLAQKILNKNEHSSRIQNSSNKLQEEYLDFLRSLITDRRWIELSGYLRSIFEQKSNDEKGSFLFFQNFSIIQEMQSYLNNLSLEHIRQNISGLDIWDGRHVWSIADEPVSITLTQQLRIFMKLSQSERISSYHEKADTYKDNYFGTNKLESELLQPLIDFELNNFEKSTSDLEGVELYRYYEDYYPNLDDKQKILNKMAEKLFEDLEFEVAYSFLKEALKKGNDHYIHYFLENHVKTLEEYKFVTDADDAEAILNFKNSGLTKTIIFDTLISNFISNIKQEEAFEFFEASINGDHERVKYYLGKYYSSLVVVDGESDSPSSKFFRSISGQIFQKTTGININENGEIVGPGSSSFPTFNDFVFSFYNLSKLEKTVFLSKFLAENLLKNEENYSKIAVLLTSEMEESEEVNLKPLLKNIVEATLSQRIGSTKIRLGIANSLADNFLRGDSRQVSNDYAIDLIMRDYRNSVSKDADIDFSLMKKKIETLLNQDVDQLRQNNNDEYQFVFDSQERFSNIARATMENMGISNLERSIIEDREKIPVGKFITELAKSLGSLGVRFLQVFGQYFSLPPELKNEFLSVYDNASDLYMVNLFQSSLTAVDTLRTSEQAALSGSQNLKEAQAKEIEEMLPNLRVIEKIGGGSINTAYLVEINGVKKVLKISNPNVLDDVAGVSELIKNVVEDLKDMDRKNESDYDVVQRLIETLKQWNTEDIQDEKFLYNDILFSDFYSNKLAKTAHEFTFEVSKINEIYNRWIKIEDYVDGDTLKDIIIDLENEVSSQNGKPTISQIVRAQRIEELISDIVADYVMHFNKSVKLADGTDGYILHSDLHVGNIMANMDDSRVSIIDRNYYLTLSQNDADLVKLLLSGQVSDMTKFTKLTEHLLETNGIKKENGWAKYWVNYLSYAKVALKNKFTRHANEEDSQVAFFNAMMQETDRLKLNFPLNIRLFVKNMAAINRLLLKIGNDTLGDYLDGDFQVDYDGKSLIESFDLESISGKNEISWLKEMVIPMIKYEIKIDPSYTHKTAQFRTVNRTLVELLI